MKAVIPAAGLGTRFLPATKAQPKEMLPVVDKPVIQYVVEEAVESGIDDILIVIGRGKRAIEDHFDKNFELEHLLANNGKTDNLNQIRRISNMAHIHFIRQKSPLGLGHAVYCAQKYIGSEAFAVLLGDTIAVTETPCLKTLIDVFHEYKSTVIAVEEVPYDSVMNYGIIEVEETGQDSIYKIKGLVEKPTKEQAPSNLAIFGRYIITPSIFNHLNQVEPGRNNEIQLTDALASLLAEEDIFAYKISGKRYDIGTKLGWIKANIEVALDRDDLSKPLKDYLKDKTKD